MKSSVALKRSLLLKQSACACLLCPGCWCTPGHNVYLQTNDNHRQGDLNHYFIIFLFVQKSRTILNSVMIMIKTEVVCWLCHHELIDSLNLFVTGTHCILQEKCDFAFPLFLGNTPSNVCQDFDTCLVG